MIIRSNETNNTEFKYDGYETINCEKNEIVDCVVNNYSN